MADIFISYAREDLERVKPIIEELEKNGWSVFWDRNLLPGSRWAIEITKALDESRCVLVVWSSSSINSEKHHWVREEAETGRERGILVPLCLDVVVLPLGFRSIQAADLSNWNNNSDDAEFQRLIEAITDIVPPPQKTTPKPASPSAIPAPSPETRSTPVQAERESAAHQQPAIPALKNGDKYGGGKVAWLDSTGKHGLIAAEADLPGYYTWDAAVHACKKLNENGYADWNLPNKKELIHLFDGSSAIGGFVDNYNYWSSSVKNENRAWGLLFFSGYDYVVGKEDYEWRVRPVRRF